MHMHDLQNTEGKSYGSDIKIRKVREADKAFWFTLDKHIPVDEFDKKVRDGLGYVLTVGNQPVGLLRYNMFWDNTPFCTMLYVDEKFRKNGYGKQLMSFWESEMLALGYTWLLTSTQSDETAQDFYRALGYKDSGYLLAPDQPAELFLSKFIKA